MSVPARKVETPIPARRPTRRPVGTPIPVKGIPSAAKQQPATRSVRRIHLGFAVFCASVLAAAIIAVVALSAFLAQTSFQISAAKDEIAVLADRHQTLTDEAARLSSPSRVASWASKNDMVIPSEVHILRVPGSPPPSVGGATEADGDGSFDLALPIKPIVGEQG